MEVLVVVQVLVELLSLNGIWHLRGVDADARASKLGTSRVRRGGNVVGRGIVVRLLLLLRLLRLLLVLLWDGASIGIVLAPGSLTNRSIFACRSLGCLRIVLLVVLLVAIRLLLRLLLLLLESWIDGTWSKRCTRWAERGPLGWACLLPRLLLLNRRRERRVYGVAFGPWWHGESMYEKGWSSKSNSSKTRRSKGSQRVQAHCRP